MESKIENSNDLSSKSNNELSSIQNANNDLKEVNKENVKAINNSQIEMDKKINKNQSKKNSISNESNVENNHFRSIENNSDNFVVQSKVNEMKNQSEIKNSIDKKNSVKRNSLNLEKGDLVNKDLNLTKDDNSNQMKNSQKNIISTNKNKVLTNSVESLNSDSSSASKTSNKKKKKNKKNKQEVSTNKIAIESRIENVSENLQQKIFENLEKVNEQKKEDQQDKNDKIPELILTENNRANKNKLLIISMLCVKFFLSFIAQIITLLTPDKKHKLPAINEPLLLLSASEITERIKNGQLKCEQIIRAYIKRIEDVQPKLNAIVDNCFEDAIKQAKEIDENLKDKKLGENLKKLPLLGVPFTCKDSISVKGLAFTSGVKIRKGIKAEKDSEVIKNLRDAGAIILGITNTPELVLWWDTDNKVYGRTNNPYDLSRIAGGSSGGEGALIAAAGSIVGVGSDILGSIRIPSMFNGIFGHKTTKKYVPIDGMFPEHPPNFDDFVCFGPICRYARDLPLMLKAMSGGPADELRLDDPVDFSKIKIYYMEWDGGSPLTSFVDRQIVSKIRQTVKHFETQYNAKSEKISINKFQFSLMYFGTRCTDKENRLQKFVTKDGNLNLVLELIKSIFGKSDITLPILIQMLNQYSPVCNPETKTHERFKKMLLDLKPKVHELLKENAVLFYPTWPTLAPKHKTTILKGFDATYTGIFNVLELPATHCATGLSKEGLPTGFTVATGINQDRLSIGFAKEIEKIYNGWCPPN